MVSTAAGRQTQVTFTRQHTAPWLAPVGAGLAGALGCVSLLVADPAASGVYPPCPFLALTGWTCPACGSLRATRALLGFDLPAAARFNLLLLLALPYLIYLWAGWMLETTGAVRLPRLRVRGGMRWAVAALGACFWLVRNLYPGSLLPVG